MINVGLATNEKGVHLTDEVFETVEVTAAKIKNRQTNTEAMLADIKAGRFRPDPDSCVARAVRIFLSATPSAAGRSR